MAREVYAFSVTIPAGTPIAAPVRPALAMPARRVTALEILVPPGPRGEVGFAIGASGNPVIPRQASSWIITDNEQIHWPLENALDNGAWQFFGYNTGTFPHVIEVRFLCDLNPGASAQAPTLLDPASLSLAAEPAGVPATPLTGSPPLPGSTDPLAVPLAHIGFVAP